MPTDGTPLDLPALRRLHEKATPGRPWKATAFGGDPTTQPLGAAAYNLSAPGAHIGKVYNRTNTRPKREAAGAVNAAFIVALVNQFDALDAALTQAAEALRDYRQSHDRYIKEADHLPPKLREYPCDCRICDGTRAALRALGMDR